MLDWRMTTCSKCGAQFEATYLKNGKAHKLCGKCRQWQRDTMRRARKRDPEGNAQYHRDLRRRYSAEAFAAYGGKCTCCGEERLEFLTFDHPDGGGRKHREAIGVGGGSNFARWLAREGYPEGYRLLCYNCNMALGYWKYCPHALV